MKIEPIIAMLNDDQDFKQKKVLELFADLLSEKEAKEVDRELLEDYLEKQKLNNDGRKSTISEKILEELEKKDLDYYRDYISRIDRKGIEFIPFYRDEYPQRLRSIPDAPLGLFVDGDLSALSDGVAIAGTRDAYEHRVEFVRKIAHKLVEMDKTVVSGLAYGVDAAAHEGALEAGGRTAAILPGDVQTIRPSGNESLGKRIRKEGALVSELTDKKSMHKGRYVERNRLTSGISSAVIIGASGETGGTIHQADFAKEQEKPRFLYEPAEDDGQSPDKLKNKGFVSFETVDELEKLLQEEFEPANNASKKPTTLDDFQ
ncbi:MAG: DNA-processing protein DprA [Candidatus Aenigmatarchaeota archaeon]